MSRLESVAIAVISLAPLFGGCAGQGVGVGFEPEPVTREDLEDAVQILHQTFLETAGTDTAGMVLAIDNRLGLAPNHPVSGTATRLLAQAYGAPFDGAAPSCPCADPFFGPTVIGLDVGEGECDWVSELTERQTRVSFLIREYDLDRGSAEAWATWFVFSPDGGAARPCEYARTWVVRLSGDDAGWEVTDSWCAIHTPVSGARRVPPPGWRGSGCQSAILRMRRGWECRPGLLGSQSRGPGRSLLCVTSRPGGS